MTSDEGGLSVGADGVPRCPWVEGAPQLVREYHDAVWGRPEHGDDRIFEWMSLGGFAAGLQWITILRKREAFRAAFSQFRTADVALYDEQRIEALMANAQIIRNRPKLVAVVSNARVASVDTDGLSATVWHFQPVNASRSTIANPAPDIDPSAKALAEELKRRGYKFVGPASIWALMQTIGLVNDHVSGCFRSLG